MTDLIHVSIPNDLEHWHLLPPFGAETLCGQRPERTLSSRSVKSRAACVDCGLVQQAWWVEHSKLGDAA